jgi:hypothetical protein
MLNIDMMKNYLKLLFAGLLSIICFLSCEKSDPAVDPPGGEGLTTEINASPGDVITFKGTFTTEGQFSKISLINESLLLNKEIVFATVVSKYYLDYKFTIPADTPYDEYIVKISAESTDGAKQDFDVVVHITSTPQATGLTLYIVASPGDEITISGMLSDAQGLALIKLENAGIGLDVNLELSENPTEYFLEYKHLIPDDAELLVHKGNIVVSNISERSVTYNLEVNLTGQEITYDQMFAAGGFQWWTWNAEHAYMMTPDAENEKWFEIDVHAWPEEGYNEIKFIGQLSWTPDNWGLVDNMDPGMGMVNNESSQPLIMDAASSLYYPAYFKVRFNPYDLEYTVEEIDQAGFPVQETMYIVGTGFSDYPLLDWNPSEAIPMERNPYGYGDHIFLIEGLQFSESVAIKFIGQNDGWGPVDVGFDEDYISDIDENESGYQVLEPISWMPTKSGDGTADLKFVDQAGAYTILYDHFAQRALIWKE